MLCFIDPFMVPRLHFEIDGYTVEHHHRFMNSNEFGTLVFKPANNIGTIEEHTVFKHCC